MMSHVMVSRSAAAMDVVTFVFYQHQVRISSSSFWPNILVENFLQILQIPTNLQYQVIFLKTITHLTLDSFLTIPVIKDGQCPAVPTGVMGMCVNQCENDAHCSGNGKCCSNGCGKVCTEPEPCKCGFPYFRIVHEENVFHAFFQVLVDEAVNDRYI